MVIKISSFKCLLWALVIIIAAMGFPLQVLTGNPYPSLLPYVLIFIIYVLTIFQRRKIGWPRNILIPKNYVGLMISVYMLLVIFHTIIQLFFGLISIFEVVSSFTIYLFPVLIYSYFREIGTEKEIKVILVSVVISSLIISIYFVYDSYIKLALHDVTVYALRAFEYSKLRSGDQNVELNDARVAIGYRSFGLLESHAVSAGWVVIGALALLSLIDYKKTIIRLLVIIMFLIFLLIGLNFTSIVSYLFIISLFEYGGISFFSFKVSYKFLNFIFISIAVTFFLSIILRMLLGDLMTDFITNNLIGQKELATGGISSQNLSMIGIIFNNLKGYFNYIITAPYVLFIGDGFSSFGMKKGGDIGFVETAVKFGLPFFLSVGYGFLTSITLAAKKKKHLLGSSKNCNINFSVLQFALSIILLIFVSEIHYTIWSSKAVIPILFFSISIIDRYLYRKSI